MEVPKVSFYWMVNSGTTGLQPLTEAGNPGVSFTLYKDGFEGQRQPPAGPGRVLL